MKANPNLLSESAAIAEKMRAFQQKLDAAMIKENPKVAPMVAKLENRQIVAPPPQPFFHPPNLNRPANPNPPPIMHPQVNSNLPSNPDRPPTNPPNP